MKSSYSLSLILIGLCVATTLALAGTTGKIAGVVKDSKTGEPLPSVNVVIEGTALGASTNIDGYYVILNVPAGRYRLVASLVGYQNASVRDVRVDIDQTTDINFQLSEEAIAGEEVTVVAQRPIVQRDVSASRANIEIQEVTKLPVTSVTSVVTLQAGVQPGLVIRGGTVDQSSFMVDGNMTRDARTLAPNTNVSLSAVQDIQIQTGGFAAEYGDLRSGVINVVTKEGGNKYSFSIQSRYSAAEPKHFGPPIYDPNGYWIRPYVDDAVAWTGTKNVWDPWTARQYPEFEGWNSVSEARLKDTDPSNDLTPAAAQQLFLWEHRRQAEIFKPDWDIDLGFGGPIPFGENAGNLRFFYSYLVGQEYYVVPLSVDAYKFVNNQLKVTSDIAGGMKLQANFRWGKQYGTNNNNSGAPGLFRSAESIGAVMNRVSYIDARMFATDYWAPSAINNNLQGLKLSHALSSSAFYEAQIQREEWRYDTNPGRNRDTTRVYRFGNNYLVDEAPFGYQPAPSTGITGLRMGVGFANSRDTTRSVTWTAKFDITSQLDKYNQFKAGIYVSYTDIDLNFGNIDVFLPKGRTFTQVHGFPIYGAFYVQDKLEFELMVANIGLRVDYVDPNTKWPVYEDNPYNAAFLPGNFYRADSLVPTEDVKPHLLLSPRLGVSFPITEYAKLFFNYGHMRQIPQPQNLFRRVRQTDNNQMILVADPREPFPRTIAYELGYEHSLMDEYLIRLAAYYKDEFYDPYFVTYTSTNGQVDYSQYTANRYRDKRGVELSLYKNRGSWVQGFINYTYDVRTTGFFGYPSYPQNTTDFRKVQNTTYPQERPIPQPFARVNLDLFTPQNFGPPVLGIDLFGDWRVNLLGRWDSGPYITWTGGSEVPGIQNNVQWTDYWNFDMRITKTFQFGSLNLQLFADITNLFNMKYLDPGGYGFFNGADYEAYMKSLHLPEFPADQKAQINYLNIPGDDRPGEFRDFGVEYQPIEPYARYEEIARLRSPHPRPFYYAADQGIYYQWLNGSWVQVDPGRLQKVLDDKAYIDMPNQETLWFLNPRRVFWGIRLAVDL